MPTIEHCLERHLLIVPEHDLSVEHLPIEKVEIFEELLELLLYVVAAPIVVICIARVSIGSRDQMPNPWITVGKDGGRGGVEEGGGCWQQTSGGATGGEGLVLDSMAGLATLWVNRSLVLLPIRSGK